MKPTSLIVFTLLAASPLHAAIYFHTGTAATYSGDGSVTTASDGAVNFTDNNIHHQSTYDIATGVSNGSLEMAFRSLSGLGNIYGSDNRVGATIGVTTTGGTLDFVRWESGNGIEKFAFDSFSGVSQFTVDINFDEFLIAPNDGPSSDGPWLSTFNAEGSGDRSLARVEYLDVSHLSGYQVSPVNSSLQTPLVTPGIHPDSSGGLIGSLINDWNYVASDPFSGNFVARTNFRSINGWDQSGDGLLIDSTPNDNVIDENEYHYASHVRFTITADDGIAGNGTDSFGPDARFIFSFSGQQNGFALDTPAPVIPEPSATVLFLLALAGVMRHRSR